MPELHLSNINLFKSILSKKVELTPVQRLVMLGIFNHRNVHTFLCFPELDTIAEETGLNEKTVRRAIERLEWLGQIVRVKTRNGKRNGRTFYFAMFDFNEALSLSDDPDATFSQYGGDYDLLQKAKDARMPF